MKSRTWLWWTVCASSLVAVVLLVGLDRAQAGKDKGPAKGKAKVAKKADKDEGEKEVSIKQVPPKVKATILKLAGKNKIEEIEQITRKCYEAEWTMKGREIEILVAPNGKVLAREVEKADDDGDKDEDKDDDEDDDEDDEDGQEISLDKVPDAVRATILKQAGKNKIEEVEAVVVTLFEAEWKANGKEVEILVAANGKLLKKEVEDEDDDDDEGDDKDEDEDDDDDDDDGHGHKDGHGHDKDDDK